MLRCLQHAVHWNFHLTRTSLSSRFFSQLTGRRNWLGCTCFCPHLLHHNRQVQRSHTKESVGAAIEAPPGNSSSLKSLYQSVTQSLTTDQNETISQTSDISLRYITVHSLYDFYEECPYGILFDVCYVDSHPDGVVGKDIKTVVFLPGSPGSHLDVLPLMKPLERAGYRVIAVNFPGYGNTNPFVRAHEFIFRGATDERSDFVLRFLQELNIDKVDMLVGQGSGCYPALDLAASHTWIKSLGLVCPGGHRVFRGISPYKRVQRMASMYDNKLLRFFLLLRVMIDKYILRRLGTKNVPLLHIIKSTVEAANYQFENMETNVFALTSRQVPVTFVYSGQDSLVEADISEELAQKMNLHPKEFAKVDSNDNFIFPDKKKTVKGLYIELGNHNPIKTQRHCDMIALMLLDELKRSTRSQS
ncbi:uncharacterized protein LOC133187285 [Saccostrea echinata]|uniref:uncharacterized protein LOC133187285 n=1 Tax=Saccostrea echinata TaxID=191078 RepID=UPI002A81D6F8|nr:uncharacterized protein LOC133187285 [Saccostrea echinata]